MESPFRRLILQVKVAFGNSTLFFFADLVAVLIDWTYLSRPILKESQRIASTSDHPQSIRKYPRTSLAVSAPAVDWRRTGGAMEKLTIFCWC